MGHLLACVNKEEVTMIKQKQRCREKVKCVYVYILFEVYSGCYNKNVIDW